MSSKISALSLLDVVTDNDYLVLARTTDSENYKYQANNLFTTLVNIGYSSPVYLIDNISTTNALSQRGLKSATNILSLAVLTSGADKNIVFDIDESAIDLSLCDNTISQFLTSTDLTAATGVTPVINGGTGLSALSDKSVLITQDSGDDALTAVPMINSGEIIIGGTSGPAVSTITAGNNMTITNGDGSIELASTFNTAESNIDMNSFNIDMSTGWINADPSNGGLTFPNPNQVYIGTEANEFFQGSTSLNVDASIVLKYKSVGQFIFAQSGAEGTPLTIMSGAASTAGQNGGDLTFMAGNGTGSGDGGDVIVQPGSTTSGDAGKVVLRNQLSGSVYDSLLVENNDVEVKEGDLKVTKTGKGLELPAGTDSQATSFTDTVTINEVSGKISLARESLAAESQAQFTVMNSTVSANSLIFVSLISPGSSLESVNAIIVAQVTNQQTGSFDVVLTNVSATTATDDYTRRLNFLVIN